MCKSMNNINKKYKYNQSILKELTIKYKVTADFVRKALSDTRLSEKAENIKKDYYKAERTLNEVTQVVLNNTINQ